MAESRNHTFTMEQIAWLDSRYRAGATSQSSDLASIKWIAGVLVVLGLATVGFLWTEIRNVQESILVLGQDLREENAILRQEFREENVILRQEVREEIGILRQEVGEEIDILRQEVSEEIGILRQEIRENRADISSLRENVSRIEAILEERLPRTVE